MRLTCQGCGAHGSYELFTSDAEARATFAAAQKMPAGLGGLMLDYLTLFRPKSRLLTWKRARKLLDELVPMIAEGVVIRDGKRSNCPPEAWRRGIEQMLAGRERLTLPLKSHGYLLEVVVASLPRLGAESEQAGEQQRQQASQRRGGGDALAFIDLAGEIAARARLKQPPMTDPEKAEFLRSRRERAPE